MTAPTKESIEELDKSFSWMTNEERNATQRAAWPSHRDFMLRALEPGRNEELVKLCNNEAEGIENMPSKFLSQRMADAARTLRKAADALAGQPAAPSQRDRCNMCGAYVTLAAPPEVAAKDRQLADAKNTPATAAQMPAGAVEDYEASVDRPAAPAKGVVPTEKELAAAREIWQSGKEGWQPEAIVANAVFRWRDLSSPHQPNAVPPGLIAALKSQKQCDMDGTECQVSRQAVDEATTILESLSASPAPERDGKPASVSGAPRRSDPHKA